MKKTNYFLEVFHAAQKVYGPMEKRLAADGWREDWQMLISTMMSAQTRDETTIPVAEKLFERYPTLQNLARARLVDVHRIIRPVNFSIRKSRYVIETSRLLLSRHKGRVPHRMEDLLKLPGVGRKTANLALSEIHNKDGVCVDTHVHRIANVLGLVKTKNPTQTERELMKLVPQKYWSQINRVFVLWGKHVRGYDKKKFLKALSDKE